jgi:hypothetical protein
MPPRTSLTSVRAVTTRAPAYLRRRNKCGFSLLLLLRLER